MFFSGTAKKDTKRQKLYISLYIYIYGNSKEKNICICVCTCICIFVCCRSVMCILNKLSG